MSAQRSSTPVVKRTARRSIQTGGWTIDPVGYTLKHRGQLVWLSLKEFALLLYLASHPDRVVTRSELLRQIWGAESFGGTRAVDLHVQRLRRKLEREGDVLIRSAGAGRYQFGGYEGFEEER